MINASDIEALMGDEYYSEEEAPMSPSQYSCWVETMMLTTGQTRLVENTLGLVGEAGEVAEKIKKYFRDGSVDPAVIVKELGDVLFYVAALSAYFDSDLQQVLDKNVEKLNSRKNRGKLQGNGDDR